MSYEHGGVGEQLKALYPAGAVPVGDWSAVVEHMHTWLTNGFPETRGIGEFTLENMQQRTLSVYRELVS